MRICRIIMPLVAVGMIFATVGCSSKATNEAAPANIARLDNIVASFSGMSDEMREATLRDYATPLSDYLYMMGLTQGDIAESIDTLAQSAAYSYFYPDVAQHFNPVSKDVERAVGHVDTNISSSFHLIPSYHYYGVVSPYSQQIMIVDSAMYIALNHYLGSDYDAYDGMPDYQRAVKTPKHLPYDIAEAAIASAYPYEADKEGTTLNRILYEGALAHGVVSAVEGGEVSEYLGWSPEQLSAVEASEADIWNVLITNRLLYSTDPTTADRLVSPAPSTSIISPMLPGRIGRYLGYKIVESYLKTNDDMTLEQLMMPEFYNDARTLINSGYTPGN